MDTSCTKRYEVFSRDRYCLYFRGSILLVMSNAHYFRGINTSYTKQLKEFSGIDTLCTRRYAIFSRGGYCLYKGIGSMFEEWILFILSNARYF